MLILSKKESGRPGSNRRHSAWKADALPTELLPPVTQRYHFFTFWYFYLQTKTLPLKTVSILRHFFTLCFCLSTVSFSLLAQSNSSPSPEVLLGKNNPYLVGEHYQLHKEAFAALEKMKAAAAKEGIQIKVVSAFRSYDRQRAIWNRKYVRNAAEGLSPAANRQKIITYSTLPGTSRHHWGTDIDIIDGNTPVDGDVLLAKHFHHGGPFERLRLWLEAHAATFGFYCAYPNTPNRTGFNYEPWHYSYRPLARTYFRAYKNLPLQEVLKDSLLKGYQDMDKAFLNAYRKTHINGIAKALK